MVKEHIDKGRRRFCITGAKSVGAVAISPLLLSSCSSSEYDAYALSTDHGKIQVYEHRDVMPLLNTVREDLKPVYRAFTALYGEESQERIRDIVERRKPGYYLERDLDWLVDVETSQEVSGILTKRDRVLGEDFLKEVEVGWYSPGSSGDNRVTLAGVRYPTGVFVARYKPRE
jgi:hypothetical protein